MQQQLSEYQHTTETRTKNQILLSTNTTKILTALNLKRQSKSKDYSKSKQFLFICLSGIPPFDNQFQNLELPGQVIVKKLSGFDKNIQEEQYIKIWNNCGFEKQANAIYEDILKKGSGKDIIFVYHSFGTYTALTFFQLYPNIKIKGLIDLGGAPIRFYKLLRQTLSEVVNVDINQMYEQKQKVHEKYKEKNQQWKQRGINLLPFVNKYQTIIFYKYIKEDRMKSMFQQHRNLPKKLKFICYGSKDILFEEDLLSEKAGFYCYENRLGEENEKELQNRYEDIFGERVKNIQQKFIFNFEGAAHSLHMQKRFNQQIKKAVHEYLQIISSEKQ